MEEKEMSNVFNRTINLTKEPMANGTIRIRRIPWDMVDINGGSGGFSPMPVGGALFTDTVTTTTISDIVDMMAGESEVELIDEVVAIQWWNSIQEFEACFGGAIGFYVTNPSAEFGFPCL